MRHKNVVMAAVVMSPELLETLEKHGIDKGHLRLLKDDKNFLLRHAYVIGTSPGFMIMHRRNEHVVVARDLFIKHLEGTLDLEQILNENWQ